MSHTFDSLSNGQLESSTSGDTTSNILYQEVMPGPHSFVTNSGKAIGKMDHDSSGATCSEPPCVGAADAGLPPEESSVKEGFIGAGVMKGVESLHQARSVNSDTDESFSKIGEEAKNLSPDLQDELRRMKEGELTPREILTGLNDDFTNGKISVDELRDGVDGVRDGLKDMIEAGLHDENVPAAEKEQIRHDLRKAVLKHTIKETVEENLQEMTPDERQDLKEELQQGSLPEAIKEEVKMKLQNGELPEGFEEFRDEIASPSSRPKA